MTTRRDFLQTAAAASGLLALGADELLARPSVAPQRILILGGTGFLGPHLVHVANQRGHKITILNRGRREPSVYEEDFKNVEEINGDRATPTAYDGLKGKTWDVIIETSGYRHPWTKEAVAALKGSAKRYMYVSSVHVHFPYSDPNIAENYRVLLKDTPPLPQPSYGVMKALSENEVKDGFGDGAIIIRPGYIVGPGDTSDRWTYWPMRIAQGGDIVVPGRKTDPVQYIDVRDLAEWMIHLIDNNINGTFNVTGPGRRQTMEEFVYGVAAITSAPLTWTWIEDYAWLKKYPLVKRPDGSTEGYVANIPWILVEGDDIGAMQIDIRKAIAAGLKFRPLADSARDMVAWRSGPTVPAALKATPRYAISLAQEKELLAAWRARKQ